MRLPGIWLLEAVPRLGFMLALPLAAFVLTVGLGMALNNGSSQPAPALDVSVSKAQATAEVPSAAAAATATPVPHRTNCGQIQGTAYQSDAERDWYLKNCTGGQASAAAGSSSGGQSASAQPGAPTTSAPAQAAAASGDRIVIAKAGVDAPIYTSVVGSDGVMRDPPGYFYAFLYDFGAFPGLGGSPERGGNAILAGHVDCGACGPGGSPGLAVFYYVRNLGPGDVIEYYTAGGKYFRYVVTAVGDYLPTDNWEAIVSSSAADLTIITCIGTFQTSIRAYTHRRVVQAKKG